MDNFLEKATVQEVNKIRLDFNVVGTAEADVYTSELVYAGSAGFFVYLTHHITYTYPIGTPPIHPLSICQQLYGHLMTKLGIGGF